MTITVTNGQIITLEIEIFAIELATYNWSPTGGVTVPINIVIIITKPK